MYFLRKTKYRNEPLNLLQSGYFFPEKSVTVSAYVSRLEKTFYLFFILCFSLSLNHGGIDNSVIHFLVHVLVRSHYFFAWFALLASIALNAALTYPLTRSLAPELVG